jgi:putative solute:sodium symporter small subunit
MGQSSKNINFFKPVGEFMTRDVRMKKLILLVWFFGNFGMLFALRFFADPADTVEVTLNTGKVVQQLTGKSFLTETAFLGFPFHYWYSAQFVIFLFIGLCYAYCKFIDKLEAKHC